MMDASLRVRLSRHLAEQESQPRQEDKDQEKSAERERPLFMRICLEPGGEQYIQHRHHGPLENAHAQDVADQHGHRPVPEAACTAPERA